MDESSPKNTGSTNSTSTGITIVPLPKINKKKSSDGETFESPKMRGYYSDCYASKNRRRKSQVVNNADVGWDDFEILKEVGKGAYGTVWLVKKKQTGKLYAMKTVDWADRVIEIIRFLSKIFIIVYTKSIEIIENRKGHLSRIRRRFRCKGHLDFPI